jgi:coniferyl-aldehyde dehydrogenase
MTTNLSSVFDDQKKAFEKDAFPSYATRLDRLDRLKEAILKYKKDLTSAVKKDFGCRSEDETYLAELIPTFDGLRGIRKNLKKWMRTEKRKVNMIYHPAQAFLVKQPKGVVGVISPWNYPLYLAFGPLMAALAAGNRVMLKPSEYTAQTSAVLHDLLSSVFSSEEVAVIQGDSEVAKKFSSLAFDHLLFTGSTTVGRAVMKAAAENLTPVTLELGGKSPAIISKGQVSSKKIGPLFFGKLLNAGQTCVAPDYVLCHKSDREVFIEMAHAYFKEFYPEGLKSSDYASLVNEKQFQRIQDLLENSKENSEKVIYCGDEAAKDIELWKSLRKIPLTLLLNPSEGSQVMREEIFGPVLPVLSYENFEEAVSYIKQRPHPLALYYFGENKEEQRKLAQECLAGGMGINETLLHVVQDDLPFGGVGASGMGRYHGYEGFQTFSHEKSVLKKGRFNTSSYVYPPFGRAFHRMLSKLNF